MKFYGEQSDSEYRIILGCANGGSNYGPRTFDDNGNKTAYAILGCWGFEDDGLPTFQNSGHSTVLIHEFNHSFVNPILDAEKADERLAQAGEKIMSVVQDAMAKQAYPYFGTVLKESVVRAAVIRYMRDNGSTEQEINNEIGAQKARSYFWMDGLDSLLGVYSSNRDKYPTLRSFYPHIETFFNQVGQDINQMNEQYQAHQPKVIAVSPDVNGRQDVDPSISELKIVFDRPVMGELKGAVGVMMRKGSDGAIEGTKETGDNFKTYKMKLKPDTEYKFRVMGRVPATEDGYYIKDYEIEFRTAK